MKLNPNERLQTNNFPHSSLMEEKNCNLVNRLSRLLFSPSVQHDNVRWKTFFPKKSTHSTMKFNFLNCFIFRSHFPHPQQSTTPIDSCQWGMREEFHFYVLFMWCDTRAKCVKHASLVMLIDVIIEKRKIVFHRNKSGNLLINFVSDCFCVWSSREAGFLLNWRIWWRSRWFNKQKVQSLYIWTFEKFLPFFSFCKKFILIFR